MKKIAVICTLYGPNGGTGRVTTEIIERYAASGNQVDVFCGNFDEQFALTSHVNSITKLNITKIGVLKQLDILFKASKTVDRKKYDIIYSTGDYYLWPDIVTIHTLKKYGRNVIEGLERKGILTKSYSKAKTFLRHIYCPIIFELGEQIVYSRFTPIYVGVSNGVVREFKKTFGQEKNTICIPNGVDTQKCAFNYAKRTAIRNDLGIENNSKVMLFVGSDWARKRLEIAIKLCSTQNDMHLIVAGNDKPGKYREMAKELDCDKRVHFIGFKRNIEDYYSAGDYFVFPSVYETFGLVVLEAMAAGMVVITNRLNGIEDFVKDGVNGFLTKDASFEEFERILTHIRFHPELEETVKKCATKSAEAYSWERCYKEYEQLFDDFIREHK